LLVSQTDTQTLPDVRLPPGSAVKGSVVDAATPANALPFAMVRFYRQRCDGSDSDCFGPNRTPPALVGQAMSDANGQFVIVLPATN
jgi:hypothetical protein